MVRKLNVYTDVNITNKDIRDMISMDLSFLIRDDSSIDYSRYRGMLVVNQDGGEFNVYAPYIEHIEIQRNDEVIQQGQERQLIRKANDLEIALYKTLCFYND